MAWHGGSWHHQVDIPQRCSESYGPYDFWDLEPGFCEWKCTDFSLPIIGKNKPMSNQDCCVSYMIYMDTRGLLSPPVVLTITTLQSVINGFKGGFENCSFTWNCPPNCPSGTYRRTCRHLPFHPGCTLKHSTNRNKQKCQRSRHDQSQRPAQNIRISI